MFEFVENYPTPSTWTGKSIVVYVKPIHIFTPKDICDNSSAD